MSNCSCSTSSSCAIATGPICHKAIVEPSGFATAISLSATKPDAPGLFSTFTSASSSSPTCGATALANVSKEAPGGTGISHVISRSEEHTSELQSRFDLVCRLLLEKKKQ